VENLRFIHDLGLEIELFTNGSAMTADLASELYAMNVRVVQKMNSFDPGVQDRLTGIRGSIVTIRESLNRLIEAGYTKNGSFLAASTVICRDNLDELPGLWEWLRDRNITPYFEIITPQGKAVKNRWLDVPSESIRALFETIGTIDRTKYGIDWTPQPPLVGNKCLRHQFSCLVTSKGDVFPCVGITIPIGNIRKQPLAEIIRTSEVMNRLKDYRNTIKGPCRSCEKAEHCYGCRGEAFQMTGDYLASDPTCWLNNGRPVG
jgi:radical SAM protein with 4Fe4S-binding SPASM domain